MSAQRIWLCAVDDIPDRQARGFDPLGSGRDVFFVVRQGDALHAWRNECPHIEGAPMAWRRHGYLSPDGEFIVCHAHGARFDIRSGQCVSGLEAHCHLAPMPLQRTANLAVDGNPVWLSVEADRLPKDH
jgi:nitrite reductase/ring-hydroxylating ferredoxin subunit